MAAEGSGRKVLICVDGSKQAEHAFDRYISEYRRDNDFVIGVVVVEFNLHGATVGLFADTDALGKQVQDKLKQVDSVRASFVQTLKDRGIKGKCETISGEKKPGPLIIEQSVAMGADLIIMGTRGLGTMRSLVSGGSVSGYVTKHANAPVIVIPYDKDKSGQKAQ